MSSTCCYDGNTVRLCFAELKTSTLLPALHTLPLAGFKVDVTVNNRLAVINTKLLRDYGAVDARLRALVLLVKHWAKRRRVNDAYVGTLSSYAYVLMCISHLQVGLGYGAGVGGSGLRVQNRPAGRRSRWHSHHNEPGKACTSQACAGHITLADGRGRQVIGMWVLRTHPMTQGNTHLM